MKRKEVVNTLNLVSLALAPDNGLVEMFKCFMFSGTDVSAYNDQISILGPCATGQAYGLHGKTLLGLLSSSRAEDIEFKVVENEVNIKTGRSIFKLPYHPKEEFLFAEAVDKWVKVVSDEAFLKGLEACLVTTSTDNTQPAFMGICLNQAENALYSCDGDAISCYALPGNDKGASSCLIPNSFCEAVLKIKEATAELVNIEVGKEWIKALIGEFTVYGRLLKVDQPLDYKAEMQKTVGQKITPVKVPKALDSALTRARVIADPESAKTTLTVEGSRLKLVTETHMGVVRDSIAFEHPDVVANTSAALVQRSIKLCDQMLILENCTVYKGDRLTVVVSNME